MLTRLPPSLSEWVGGVGWGAQEASSQRTHIDRTGQKGGFFFAPNYSRSVDR